MKKLISISIVLCLCASPILASTISNGGATILEKDVKEGKVELCFPVQNKKYNSPSWIQHVMSPVTSISNGIAGILQLPVMLVRSAERPLEQSVSDSRKETNTCFQTRYRKGQNFSGDFNLQGVDMGDSVTIDKLSVSVNINSDTE